MSVATICKHQLSELGRILQNLSFITLFNVPTVEIAYRLNFIDSTIHRSAYLISKGKSE